MAWYERDYNRDDDTQGPRIGGGMQPWSMVLILLVATCVLYLLQEILEGSSRGGFLSPSDWLIFDIERGLKRYQLWRPFTYVLLHTEFFHLLFNMIGLYFFGPMMERYWGSRRFLAFYFLCGLGGALLFTLLVLTPGLMQTRPNAGLLGASGSVMGILAACAVIAPRQQVRLLFPPVSMQMRTLTLIFLGIAVFSVTVGARNDGGEAAHLGGAAMGFLLVKFPWTLDWADRLSLGKGRQRFEQSRRERDLKKDAAFDQEIDRILAKVKQQGLHSLTRGEKRTLEKARKR